MQKITGSRGRNTENTDWMDTHRLIENKKEVLVESVVIK